MLKEYEAVIGLEIHAELQTRSKMFCACPVVDFDPGGAQHHRLPGVRRHAGMLPVVNQQAVEYGLRVALALDCAILPSSIFARKNYFYPDLPKGYQISQYEQPLAEHGKIAVQTVKGEQTIRITRVHLEEDTGKLTHIHTAKENYSLVDLNRAGVPLLEIVSEPDMHSLEAVRAYATAIRSLLRYLGVNSGDMEKGVIRFEANVSIRPRGAAVLNTRVEIKNLNSFRALERWWVTRSSAQTGLANRGQPVIQETLGWDEAERDNLLAAQQGRSPRLPLFPRARPAAAGDRKRLDRAGARRPARAALCALQALPEPVRVERLRCQPAGQRCAGGGLFRAGRRGGAGPAGQEHRQLDVGRAVQPDERARREHQRNTHPARRAGRPDPGGHPAGRHQRRHRQDCAGRDGRQRQSRRPDHRRGRPAPDLRQRLNRQPGGQGAAPRIRKK